MLFFCQPASQLGTAPDPFMAKAASWAAMAQLGKFSLFITGSSG